MNEKKIEKLKNIFESDEWLSIEKEKSEKLDIFYINGEINKFNYKPQYLCLYDFGDSHFHLFRRSESYWAYYYSVEVKELFNNITPNNFNETARHAGLVYSGGFGKLINPKNYSKLLFRGETIYGKYSLQIPKNNIESFRELKLKFNNWKVKSEHGELVELNIYNI